MTARTGLARPAKAASPAAAPHRRKGLTMLRRRILAFAAAVLAVIAIGGLAATAAQATAVGNITTFNGNRYNLNSVNFNYGSVLISSNGARTVCAPSAGNTGIVQLCGSNRPDNDRCIVADSANTYTVHIGHCNAIGSLWINVDNGDGSRDLINNHYTDRHLAGDNNAGDAWAALPTNIVGWYHKLYPIG